MIRVRWVLAGVASCALVCASIAAEGAPELDANRLTYLDENDPFYVGRTFPKLITPQWIGEPGVEAVVVLAIDDMTQPAKWEKFLRPILERLKHIDSRAPVSIMTVKVDPLDPQLQAWLKEGLSLETHTLTHPCPCLAKGDFQAAASNYHNCVELMNRVLANHPVAFRMPCCDSMNSPSPRFYAEIFNRTNSLGQFLTIDSSVMNIITTNDPSLPPAMVMEAAGRERFRKYVPFPSFATTIEDYPYPYAIGKLCWEFPGVVPSDWEAQHLHGTNNPATVADWKAALDATVRKQGTMNLIFHPHGWIRPEQIVELIDYAAQQYGKKVKFLTFREAQERLDKNLLHGVPLRAANGQDNGARLLDLNGDGYLDVIVANEQRTETYFWEPKRRTWNPTKFPVALTAPDEHGQRSQAGLRFGIIRQNRVSALICTETMRKAWTFAGTAWAADDELLAGLELEGKPVLTASNSANGPRDRGVRLRDVDGDGRCELIVANESQNALFGWAEEEKHWQRLPYSLPDNTAIVDPEGRDAGLRFVDVNEDGLADVLFSNEKTFSLNLFIPEVYLGFKKGWSREVLSGRRGQFGEIPMIARNGSNNGAWLHGRTLWVQNEDTAALPDKVDRRSFDSLLAGLQPPPLSPEDSLKALRVKPGFKAELVAHEPLVQDPIAFEWGADGKLWVVEMGDYPLGVDGKGKPGGIVRFLEDTNQDGIYDKSTVFLEGVNFPTGVMPWGRGVIVSAAPEIFYAEDTDGDGKADVRKALFTGFREGNQQHRLNGFDYGLDNWLYGANGDSGGRVRSELTGKTVNISGRDFRFRPGDGAFETQAGNAQYGRHRDDWGNWFGNNNSAWVWHYFLPEQYLARNPHLAVRATKRILANYPGGTRVFPASRLLQRFNDIGMAGHVTSACSATPYRDELLGADYTHSVFTCEPVHNLVHREILEPNGVTFSSHRAADEQQSEFLASTDNWFRPVMVKTGPDGALYIADMYRLVIEHPEWIPNDVKHQLDLRAGHDKGRIYRVYPEGGALRRIPRLDQLDTAGLVAALDSPNGWQRDTAQRLLVERMDKRAVQLLGSLFHNRQRPKTRLQILGTLEGLGGVTTDLVQLALGDPHPAVREQAIRVSEALLRNENTAAASGPVPAGKSEGKPSALAEALLKRADDPAIRVRYQLAFTLGEWADPRAADALVKLAAKDPGDGYYMQTAIMSSAPRHIGTMLVAALDASVEAAPEFLDKLLGLATALKDERPLAQALAKVGKNGAGGYQPWQFSALAAVLDALDRRGDSLTKFHKETSAELRTAVEQLGGIFSDARDRVKRQLQSGHVQSDFMPALNLLARGLTEREQDIAELGHLLQPTFPVNVQEAALAGLSRAGGKPVADILISKWQASSPELRGGLLATLFTRQEWIQALLSALETGRIPASQLSPADQQRLLRHETRSISDRATKLLSAIDSDRQNIVASYKEVAGLKGDPQRGAALLQQNCAMCHEARDGRAQVGPDLGALADKSIETLLIAILDPNRAVESRYVNYTAVTKDERELSGVIVAETANNITLRSPAGEETILRSDLQQLTSSGLSLMPEGFEKILSPQDAADVIAHITDRAQLKAAR